MNNFVQKNYICVRLEALPGGESSREHTAYIVQYMSTHKLIKGGAKEISNPWRATLHTQQEM